MKTGLQIKLIILENGLKLWQVAERLNINEGNFSRRLRRPFNDGETQRIFDIIAKIKSERSESND